MDNVVTSGRLGGDMVSTLDQKARYAGSIPTLGAIFPIFITPHDTDCHYLNPVQPTCLIVVEAEILLHEKTTIKQPYISHNISLDILLISYRSLVGPSPTPCFIYIYIIHYISNIFIYSLK